MRYGFILAFMVLLIFSCKKEKKSNADFDFDVQGIEDIHGNIGETMTDTLKVILTGGTSDTVLLSVENVPEGVDCSLKIQRGIPEFETSLIVRISKEVRLGDYVLMLLATSKGLTKTYPVHLSINDQLSAIITVYNSTLWSPERSSGELMQGAKVELYASQEEFDQLLPFYSTETMSDGRAYLYNVPEGNYIFLVSKDGLSNIVEKIPVNNVAMGFISIGIFRSSAEIINSAQPDAVVGDLKFRDLNVDGKITDADRARFDYLAVYGGEIAQRVIWVGY